MLNNITLLSSVGNSLASHSGFEPCLCFGDVLLSFAFTGSSTNSSSQSVSNTPGTTNTTGPLPSPSVTLPEIPEVTTDSKHDFVRTHFEKVTQCGFCFKKVIDRYLLFFKDKSNN